MSMLEVFHSDKYEDGRTKQSFRDQCDINKIVKRAAKAGGLSHLQKYNEAVYGEFEGYNLLEAFDKVSKSQKIFDDLPSDVRAEFDGDAFKFAEFASNPENNSRLAELIPALARPREVYPNPVHRGRGGAGAASPQEEAGVLQASHKGAEKAPEPGPADVPGDTASSST